MPHYLIQASHTGEGWGSQIRCPQNRLEALRPPIEGLGGWIESFYYAFGDSDVYLIADMPDNASMAAVALVANASGAVTIKTTVLMTPEELDEAVQKTPDYRAPGQ